MPLRLKPLSQQTIVITGPTSGIGLATAIAAAREGANLVLAARSETVLKDVERQIKAEKPSAKILTVVTDVSDKAQVQKLSDAAVSKFGSYDTWVNNAGVSIYGQLQEISDEDHRQLFETNFWGVVHGSLVAVPQLKKTSGVLINLGSELSEHGITLQGMYAASKHAIKGFTDSLRMELDEEGAPVAVTLIKPAAIATPFPEHAKNYTNKQAMLPQPIYAPEEAAYAILHAATTPTRDAYVGGGAKMTSVMSKLAPRAFDWLAEKLGQSQLRDEAETDTGSNLYDGYSQGNTRGTRAGFVMEKSLYTRASLHPLATSLILAGIGVGLYSLINSFQPAETPQQRYRRRLQSVRSHIPDLSSKLTQLRRAIG